MAARLRFVHPFPSFLNAGATAVLGALAGAEPLVAGRLGLAMLGIQFSIGALNDIVDARRDRGRRPIKPVAAGLVRWQDAAAVAVLAGSVGLGLAAASGPSAAVVAAAGAVCGYAYDLRLSRTAWAWLPLAVALPLVPVFAWVGVTGTVPGAMLVLIPIGMLAGGGLAVGNALVDVEADRSVGAPSLAVRLGRRNAAGLHLAALGAASGLAVVTLPPAAASVSLAVAASGATILGVGLAMLVRAGGVDWASRARLGWQLEAFGTAILGIGWVLALVGGGQGAGLAPDLRAGLGAG